MAIDKALELDSDFPEAWFGKERALSGLGRNEEGLEAFDEALRLNPSYPDVWTRKAT